ncbi:M23 family metallopeptidase [Actinomyces bowdenii]|uniref:murein hydrolase activator EnvC family protein n=1 Tax=Actinomyces bowdenii TaxID=131109 RepID=UPI00214B3C47|nr:M23 family metallopeptidase [Actinomyces bowdenii]
MTTAGAAPADAPPLAASGGAPAAPAALTASVAWETGAVMRDVTPSWRTRAVAGTGGALAAAPAGGEPRGRGRYSWPTGGPAPVVEGFDPPAVAWGRGHRGVDLAAPEGSQVRSAGDGVVAFAGVVAGRPVVSVDHADGIRTTYEPVEPVVSAGQAVARGEVIGTLLAGHRGDGVSALHWGARTGPKTYVNPLRLLQPPVIRLKPVEG